jgi:hypothetical protein
VHIGQQRPAAAAALERLVRDQPWMLSVLAAARACGAPYCWVGGGVLRDLVWDQLHGGFDPAGIKDVDVAFFDPGDLTSEADQAVEAALRRLAQQVPWDAKNQAAVHRWYQQRFGYPVEPLRSAGDGDRRSGTPGRQRPAPDHGGVRAGGPAPGGVSPHPRRVTIEWYRQRIRAKQVATRWPNVQIHW